MGFRWARLLLSDVRMGNFDSVHPPPIYARGAIKAFRREEIHDDCCIGDIEARLIIGEIRTLARPERCLRRDSVYFEALQRLCIHTLVVLIYVYKVYPYRNRTLLQTHGIQYSIRT